MLYMGIQVGWFFIDCLSKEMKPKLGIIPLPGPTYFRCLVIHIHTLSLGNIHDFILAKE